ncbi:MAG: LytR/AlgR family response regulator transcription factor, partial [Aurantibacter sp.]
IVVTNILAQGFIVLQTEIVNALFGDGPLPTAFYTYSLFIFFIWILVINGIYIGIYFYDQWHYTISLREKDKKLRSTGFSVQLGKTVNTIPFDNIAAFYVDEGITYLKTLECKNYVIDQSLNKIMNRLPTEYFYRLNRKYIIHRNLIRGYKRDTNGKLKAVLNENFNLPDTLTISRITAPAFKKWFSISTQPA